MSYNQNWPDGRQGPYGQQQPNVPYVPAPARPVYDPADSGLMQPSPPPERRARWPYAVLAVAVLVLGGAVWTAYDRNVIFKDSGIEACEAFRDSKTVQGAPVDTTADGKMTEDQYLKIRNIFKDSRYEDIRTAGTRMMDVLWQVSQMGKDAGLELLPFLGQITSALTDMQGACANHGIVINLLKDAKVTK